jgi:BirA family transcriptional regulator, biotin operon repressor / biotin---[acetyl-CoA-carboxylase] ligase
MSQLSPLFIGRSRLVYASLASTNEAAGELLASHPPDGTLVLAHAQTRGKGQAGNVWYSQAGENFSGSFILYPSFIPPEPVFILNRLASVAVLRALQTLAPDQNFQIKWPNDLYCNGKKIAGILIENQWNTGTLRSAVIGIGVNVNNTEFPEALKASACSLHLCTGKTYAIEHVADHIAACMEPLYLQLRSGNKAALQKAYLDNLYRYQEWSNYALPDTPDTIFSSMIIGIDAQGKLALQTLDQKVLYFDLKEIVFCP